MYEHKQSLPKEETLTVGIIWINIWICSIPTLDKTIASTTVTLLPSATHYHTENWTTGGGSMQKCFNKFYFQVCLSTSYKHVHIQSQSYIYNFLFSKCLRNARLVHNTFSEHRNWSGSLTFPCESHNEHSEGRFSKHSNFLTHSLLCHS